MHRPHHDGQPEHREPETGLHPPLRNIHSRTRSDWLPSAPGVEDHAVDHDGDGERAHDRIDTRCAGNRHCELEPSDWNQQRRGHPRQCASVGKPQHDAILVLAVIVGKPLGVVKQNSVGAPNKPLQKNENATCDFWT
jgi:hypothetical protein